MRQVDQVIDAGGTDAVELINSYRTAALMYTFRLMLRSTVYGLGKEAIDLTSRQLNLKSNEIRSLDYGCGVADTSLWLAMHGASCTMVDLEDEKLDFARYRFNVRGLRATFIGAKGTEKPVSIPASYNVVILSKVLQHVRDPKLFLSRILEHTEPGAIVFESFGPVHGPDLVGGLLSETKTNMIGSNYEEYHRSILVPLWMESAGTGSRYWYRKRAPQ